MKQTIWLWTINLLFLLSGCGPITPALTSENSDSVNFSRTLGIAYDALSHHHVTPLNLAAFSTAGLAELGLSKTSIPNLSNGSSVGSGINRAIESTPRLQSQSQQDLLERFINAGLANTRGDVRFTSYLTPTQVAVFNSTIQGSIGIGIQVTNHSKGLRVSRVRPGSSADQAKIIPGDLIISVDGKRLDNLPDLNARLATLAGSNRQSVQLTLSRNGSLHRLTLVRERQTLNQFSQSKHFNSVAYIPLNIFDAKSARHVRDSYRALARTRPINGMVLDLRGNAGGSVSQAQQILDLFLRRGTPFFRVGNASNSTVQTAQSAAFIPPELPLVILIDTNSASASELVASALQDTGRGVVLGSQSHGKGSQQIILPLPNGGALAITNAFIFRANGRPLSYLGVTPQICASRVSSGSALITNLLAGQQQALRQQAERTQSQSRVRALCPPREDFSTQTLDLALKLLSSQAAYNAALNL